MRGQVIAGRLATGIGQGRHFTRLEWVRRQFMAELGIDPFPGTINLIVDSPEDLAVWERLKATPGIRIENPNDGPHDCDARCYNVSIEGRIDAAIVLPEVAGYSGSLLEIIAATAIRETLAIKDGDRLRLVVS